MLKSPLHCYVLHKDRHSPPLGWFFCSLVIFLEPIGTAKPKLSQKSDFQRFSEVLNEAISLLCPAQASPTPSFRLVIVRDHQWLTLQNQLGLPSQNFPWSRTARPSLNFWASRLPFYALHKHHLSQQSGINVQNAESFAIPQQNQLDQRFLNSLRTPGHCPS